MIYVPDIENYECYVVQSEGVLRAYEEKPTYNSVINHRDYYINSNYIYRDGVSNFGSYATLPICLSSSNITTDFYYRNDIAQILFVFVVLCIFGIYLPLKIFFRIFKRGRLL